VIIAALSLTIVEKNISISELDFARCMGEKQLFQRGNTDSYRAVVAVRTGVVTYDPEQIPREKDHD